MRYECSAVFLAPIVTREIEAEDYYAAYEAFRIAEGFRPNHIGDREVYEHCEDCGRPIFLDELPDIDFVYDDNGIYWHSETSPNCLRSRA